MDDSFQVFLRLPRPWRFVTKHAMGMLEFLRVLDRLCYTKQGLQELNWFVCTTNASQKKSGVQVGKGKSV